ncbi:MAG: hypothetical protein V3U29_01160, partial [Phycisphaeraceae bacterium]
MEEAHKPPSGWGAVWRQALAVAIGAVAAGAVIVPGATLWNELNEPDISGLADDVQSLMQRNLRADETWGKYDLTIQHITIVETGKNTYTGMATVKPQRGSAKDVEVIV